MLHTLVFLVTTRLIAACQDAGSSRDKLTTPVDFIHALVCSCRLMFHAHKPQSSAGSSSHGLIVWCLLFTLKFRFFMIGKVYWKTLQALNSDTNSTPCLQVTYKCLFFTDPHQFKANTWDLFNINTREYHQYLLNITLKSTIQYHGHWSHAVTTSLQNWE